MGSRQSRASLRETAAATHIGRRHSNENISYVNSPQQPLRFAAADYGTKMSHSHVSSSVSGRQHPETYWDRLLVVKFYEDNCDDCTAMRNQFEDLVPRYRDVVFLEANVVENLETASEMNIRLLPTFILFKNYVEVDRLVDTKRGKLEDLIKKHLKR